MSEQPYSRNVFINCPFDEDYKPLMRAMLFTVIKSSCFPRLALERSDSSESRLDKIRELIDQSRYSIHDLSRIDLPDGDTFPRYNMPFELGLFFGCKYYGEQKHKNKMCLVFDKERYRYQQVLSDLSGSDIEDHDNEPELIVGKIRNWLSNSGINGLQHGKSIWVEYNVFRTQLETSLYNQGLTIDDITINDYIDFIRENYIS